MCTAGLRLRANDGHRSSGATDTSHPSELSNPVRMLRRCEVQGVHLRGPRKKCEVRIQPDHLPQVITCFTRTSRYEPTERHVRTARGLPDCPLESPVGMGLWTSFPPRVLWITWGCTAGKPSFRTACVASISPGQTCLPGQLARGLLAISQVG